MGLGLHGGGLASSRFLLERGAEITVTDLRDEETLQPVIKELDTAQRNLNCKPVRYILGKHEIDDFKKADIVIKNPGVRPDSVYLQAAKCIETDLSLFLMESPARLFAVTGSKGKSGTASALHYILSKDRKAGNSFLGGNITVSPLTFLNSLTKDDDVVLELSSFQLGDIKNRKLNDTSPLLKPAAAILTTIMEDHLDRYGTMTQYIEDKRNIYRGQDASCITVAGDDDWGKSFLSESKARSLIWSKSILTENQSGGWINEYGVGLARFINWENISDEITELVPNKLLTPGKHQKLNFLISALAAYAMGVKAQTIRDSLCTYKGIEHRLELFHEENGVRFFNDSAATIPEAAAACIEALTNIDNIKTPLILVTGGTDKNLNFSPLAKEAKNAKELILLEGSGSVKLAKLLDENGISYNGPFDDLEKAVSCAKEKAISGDTVALSPGCASFGMFLNEFDRGRKWKEAVLRLTHLDMN